MSWDKIAYAALCVVVPLVWGLIVYWISSLIEKRVLRGRPGSHGKGTNPTGDEETTLPLDYHI